MRRGATPKEAATTAVRRIAKHYPNFVGAVIALDKNGTYGAACNGLPDGFPHFVASLGVGEPTLIHETCIKLVSHNKVEFIN